MAITRAYTINTGGNINNTKQIGYIAASIDNENLDYSNGSDWVMGPDESLGYIIASLKNYGLIINGDFSDSVTNFNWGTYNTTDQYSGNGCLEYTGGGGGSSQSDYFLPVNTSETYSYSMYVRTLQRGSDGDLAGGHIGFACYDKNKSFIDLRNCGGLCSTYLTRELNAGDLYVYVDSSVNNWRTVGTSHYNHFMVYPSTHPDYSIAHEYTRIGYGDYYIYYNEITDIGGGEIRLKLANSSLVDTVFPDIGYPTPSGTPVDNGVAGGSYNYALGAPYYPETWTKYSVSDFTGENRNSGTPFRYATKYIKFLILKNYNNRSDIQDHVWAIDNIYFSNTKRIY